MADSELLPPKFSDPFVTAKGETRAHVEYGRTKTLWFNTGTLCNIECVNCYIESSPTNDRLVYLTMADVLPYLDELEAAGETGIEIGFTGGEPFMAPQMNAILQVVLERGFSVLMLTNAMQPMMRPRVRDGLLALREAYGDRLTMRVSLDHYDARLPRRGAGRRLLSNWRSRGCAGCLRTASPWPSPDAPSGEKLRQCRAQAMKD